MTRDSETDLVERGLAKLASSSSSTSLFQFFMVCFHLNQALVKPHLYITSDILQATFALNV